MRSFSLHGAQAGPAPDPAAFRLGAEAIDGAARFLVWAPRAKTAELHIVGPGECVIELPAARDGYRFTVAEGLTAGTCYFYRIDGDDLPDPASRYQPQGVHGPSEVVSEEFAWTDSKWRGISLESYVFYELHAGTYTAEGTFDAVIPQLDYLAGLGVTAIELMPVAQFPGVRNWGYDGVYPFAVQNSYGGPGGLRRLVDSAHRRGIAVVLDVVYNHLGPEGNYLSWFGPYFTDRYTTPWGEAVNFDGRNAGPVRRYFIENALHWIRDFHIDALRLDAVHGISDNSPCHFLQELAEEVHAEAGRLGRQVHLIAESDLNQPRLVRPTSAGGYGLDAQWADDLHHALHGLLTRESTGYYADFGDLEQLAAAYRSGYVFTGQHSQYRGRPHGEPPTGVPKARFVVCSQNHDQVGNRMLGERLPALIPYEGLKLAAGAVLLSPFLPLLFMGEEYGETAPFLYFASHSDPTLVEAVRTGRLEEFAAFRWIGEVPDAHDEETFNRSRLDPSRRSAVKNARLLDLYRTLLSIRATLAPATLANQPVEAIAFEEQSVVTVRRESVGGENVLVLHFGAESNRVEVPAAKGVWRKVIDSADAAWLGPGSAVPGQIRSGGTLPVNMAPLSFCLLRLEA